MERCVNDDAELREVEIDYEYKGVIVRGVKAMRCPVCGEETITLEEYGKLKKRIEAVVQPLKLRRKISVAGKMAAVYLPEDVMKAAGARIGDEVEIYTEGKRIVIEPVEEPETAEAA